MGAQVQVPLPPHPGPSPRTHRHHEARQRPAGDVHAVAVRKVVGRQVHKGKDRSRWYYLQQAVGGEGVAARSGIAGGSQGGGGRGHSRVQPRDYVAPGGVLELVEGVVGDSGADWGHRAGAGGGAQAEDLIKAAELCGGGQRGYRSNKAQMGELPTSPARCANTHGLFWRYCMRVARTMVFKHALSEVLVGIEEMAHSQAYLVRLPVASMRQSESHRPKEAYLRTRVAPLVRYARK